MKKLLSGILCASMLFSNAVFAAENQMKDALAAVKGKAAIPAELTEFDSRSFNSEERTNYYFTWHNEDGTRELQISCDDEGRIDSYSEYRQYNSNEELPLSHIRRDRAKAYAEEFVKKIMPETFGGDDTLVCNEESGSLNRRGTRYGFSFTRQKNGIDVSNNVVSVNVLAAGDDMYISDMWANYDYHAEFNTPEREIDDPVTPYKSVFPLKLHYVKDYEASEGSDIDVTKLIYTVREYGRGYISAAAGEEVIENYDFKAGSGGGSNGNLKQEASASDSAANRFTEQELAELEAVAGLKSPQEIEATLRGLDDLKMDEDLRLDSYSIYKNQDRYTPYPIAKNEDGKKPEDTYTMNLRFVKDEGNRNLSAEVNAKTGEFSYISNRKYTDRPYDAEYTEAPLTEEQKSNAEEKMTGFFALVAPEIHADFAINDINDYSDTVSASYARMANGIEYSDNYASISYDIENEMISYYSVHHTDAEFADPAPAIAAEQQCYDTLLEKYPLKKVYIRTESGKYELCWQMSGFSQINALTGETESAEEAITGEYSDISGHWSEEAVSALSDIGIGFTGSEFKPDEPVTKAELLALFASGLKGLGYIHYDTFSLMDEMKHTGIIPKDEPIENSESPVAREDACVYMIRFAGHEKIAKLDVFKTDYLDSDSISPEKLGYAAILSGMDVVSGFGGYLRPADLITRAEAATMLYKYLIHR